MNHKLTGEYKDIILVPMNFEDSESFRQLRNREENRKWFVYNNEITMEAQIKWFENYLDKAGEYMFSAYHKAQPNKFIGAVSIYDENKDSKQAEFGRIIVDKQLISEKGVGFMITYCVCKIAFNQIQLKKVKLEVYEDNLPAIKMYEKVGFSKVSTIKINDRNLIIMELLKDDFIKQNN